MDDPLPAAVILETQKDWDSLTVDVDEQTSPDLGTEAWATRRLEFCVHLILQASAPSFSPKKPELAADSKDSS